MILTPRDLALALALRSRTRARRDHRLRVSRAGVVIELFAIEPPVAPVRD